MQDIFNLIENPSWVGTLVKLGLHKLQASIFQIVSKLLQDKALEEGEEYEYIPIKPLDPRGSGTLSTPKRGENPAADDALAETNDYTGASTNNVCSLIGDERKIGYLPGFSPRCVCSPSDSTEGGGTKDQYP